MLLLCSEPSQMSSTGAHRPMRFVTPALSPLWPVSRSYCSLGKIYRTGFLVSSSISGTFLPHGLGIFYHLASWLKASPLFRVYKRAFLNKKWPYTIKYTASNSKSSPFFSLLQNVSEKAILCFREAFCFFFSWSETCTIVFHSGVHGPLASESLEVFKNATLFHLSQKLWVLRPECQQTCRLVCIKVWQPLLCAVWIMELQWLPYYVSGRKVWVKL